MKRYMLFAYRYYYRLGGWSDFKGAFDSIEEAVKAGREFMDKEHLDNFEVIDKEDGWDVADKRTELPK